MTTARQLYEKVGRDLEKAQKDRDLLKSQFSNVSARIGIAENELDRIVWHLMPEAQLALPELFPELAETLREAEAALKACENDATSANADLERLTIECERERVSLGERLDQERSTFKGSDEYKLADKRANEAEAAFAEARATLSRNQKELTRLTQASEKRAIHRLLLASNASSKEAGHFSQAIWRALAGRLKRTKWFQKMDSPRASIAQTVAEARVRFDEAVQEVKSAKQALKKLNNDFEATLQPARQAFHDKIIELEQTRQRIEYIRSAHQALTQKVLDLRAGRVEPMISAKATLASILDRELGTASSEELEHIKAIAERPGTAPFIAQAVELAEVKRNATLEKKSVVEQIDALDTAISKLEELKRKMSKKGLSRSNRKIKDAESYMLTGTVGDIGSIIATAAFISNVSDNVSEICDVGSTSSSSDWSSSSSDFSSSSSW
jgi:hypothetical protein